MEKNHYIHYTAADLLNDGTFLDSMQHPTEQSEKFWSQLEKENETFAGELRMARSFLMAVAESLKNGWQTMKWGHFGSELAGR